MSSNKIETNFEHFSASVENMSKILAKVAYDRNTEKAPWESTFRNNFCNGCKKVKIDLLSCHGQIYLHPCEFEPYICRYGNDIAWFLNQPYCCKE